MKDRGGQRGVGAAIGQDADEVLGLPCPAAGDHRDVHASRDRLGQLAVEAVWTPSVSMEVSRISPAPSSSPRAPIRRRRSLRRRGRRACRRATSPAATAPRIDGEHHGLRAEFAAEFRDQLGPAHGGGVDRHLVGARQRMRRASATERMPPPTASGMKTLRAVRATTPAMMSRASQEAVMSRKTSSSAPLRVVALGELDRVARIAQIDEIDALDDTAAGHVEAGNDAFG